jgi:hypothetical protein
MLGVILAIPGVVFIVDNATSRKPYEIDLAQEAEYQCRSFIRSNLHDPASAEFPLGRFVSEKQPDGSWVVVREVRAPNGFNAMRLANFSCKVSYSGSPDQQYNTSKWIWLDLKEIGIN